MLHIAICDDESQHRSDLRCILETYLRSRGLAARIWEFESGAALLSSVSDQQDYDLYLLDVVMPGLNGIQVGLQLRQTNHTGILLYLTNSPDYAVDSYRTKAFYYLLKPLQQPQFYEIMDQAVAQLERSLSVSIAVKTKSGILRLPLDHILYAELTNRCVRYYLHNGSYVDSLSLTTPFRIAVTPLLTDSRFLLVGASFALNLYYISAVNKDGVTLKDGRILSLPKSACASLRGAWVNYWLEGE